ncbi:MAG: hypothetical protein ACFE85_13780 [Candidatus Hodarchaeota archaeon]
MSSEEISDEAFWKLLLRKHWMRLIPFILVVIGAFIGGILVFLRYINLEGYASWTFNDWSFGGVWVFLFWIALWELLIVGLPTLAVFCILGFLMWRTLPEEDRAEIKRRGKSEETWKERKERSWKEKAGEKKKTGGGGGLSFVIWLIFLIKVAVDGNWNKTFDLLDFSYFVDTFLFALFWVAIIGGPLALIGIIFWLRKYLKE